MTARVFSSNFFIVVIIMALNILVYGNTFLNDWTYDDYAVIVNNPDSHSLSGFIENHSKTRPVSELTYIVDYNLFGDDPSGYHVQHIIWHAGNGFLLFLVFKLLGVELIPALLGVGLFLVHPVQSESLANLSHRKQLLPLFFGLSSFLIYAKAMASRARTRWPLIFISGVLFVVAFFSNITVVTMPLVIVLFEWLFVKQQNRILLKRPYLPRVGIAVLLVILFFSLIDFSSYAVSSYKESLRTLYVQNGFFNEEKIFPFIAGLFKSYTLYVFNIAIPVGLAPEYSIEFSDSLFQWQAWMGLVLVFAMGFIFFKMRKSLPVLVFGLGWFVILFLPVSNLYPSAYIMADRYLYMCLPGLSLCLAAVLQRWYSKRLVIISCLMLLILSVLTVVQNSYWRDSQILWRHAIKVNPQSSGARWFGALTAIEKGEYETAKEHLHKMIEINRFYMLAYYHLAKVEEKTGNLKEALKNYEFFARYGVMTGNLEEVARVKAYLPVLRARINRGG